MDSARLSAPARTAIGDGDTTVFVSAASAWELAAKVRLGRLPELAAFCAALPQAIAEQGFEPLPVTVEDGRRAGLAPEPHRDPVGRMLIAQALGHDLTLVSCETPFDAYGIARLW